MWMLQAEIIQQPTLLRVPSFLTLGSANSSFMPDLPALAPKRAGNSVASLRKSTIAALQNGPHPLPETLTASPFVQQHSQYLMDISRSGQDVSVVFLQGETSHITTASSSTAEAAHPLRASRE